MADFGNSYGTPNTESWGVNSSGASGGTTVSSTTEHTYGSWAQLKAASGIEATHLIVGIADPNGGSDIVVDIGIGGAGSEVVVAEALAVRGEGSLRNSGVDYSIPLRIPAGSRVSARMKGSAASRNCQVSVRAIAGPSPYSSFEKMEFVGSAAFATTGYTNNAKGAWSQMVASIPNDLKALHLLWANVDTSSGQSSAALMDFGFGVAGSEIVLVQDLHATAQGSTAGVIYHNAFVPIGLPAGTRLAMRGQVSAGSSSRYLVMTAHGYR